MPELRLVREAETRNFQSDVLRNILPKQLPMQRLYANLQAVYSDILRSLPQPGADLKLQQTNLTPQPQQTVAPKLGTTDKEVLQLLQNLTSKGNQPALADRFGPKLIQAAKNILSAVVPNSTNITPAQLRQAILGYGLFMEAQLAAGQPPSASYKGDLLQLLFQIANLIKPDKAQLPTQVTANKPTTPQMESGFIKLLEILFRHTEGSLARVQLNQLASLPTEEGSRQMWQFEVPVKHQDHVDSFLIQLEQEQAKNRGDDTKPIWYVTLTFNIEPLGPVKAKISMHDEEVSTVFLAEKPESAEMLNKRMSELNKAFTESGLNVGKLLACHGDAQPEKPQQTIITQLLDEKA
jgi:flagellar hook-length control protein FliK